MLRVSENRALRRIFGPEKDEATGEGRQLCKEELICCVIFTKYYLGDQIKKNKMGELCSTYEGEERCIQDFGGETQRKEMTWKTQAWMGR